MNQTLKRSIADLNVDEKGSKESLVSKISAIIENIKLIQNTTTKNAPFETLFGRKPKT